MIRTLAFANYRSLHDFIVPLDQLNLITGPNGSGKSNVYRGLRLLADTAFGTVNDSLAKEGGFVSALWAGPESFSRQNRSRETEVQGGPRKNPVRLRLGFIGDDFGYAIDFGLPIASNTVFVHDPEIKREAIWHGNQIWHDRRAMVDRRANVARVRDDKGRWQLAQANLPTYDSMLSRLVDPKRAPEVVLAREAIRSWRFYDQFRTDIDAPARNTQIGTLTPVLSNDGHDLAAAWQTILEIGDRDALEAALVDAFPDSQVNVVNEQGKLHLEFMQNGLLRPLSQAELSDGTLRYLLWIAALLTPRPPEMMVLNEPETSLHPELLPALARLMLLCADSTQLWVISHSDILINELLSLGTCNRIELEKDLGETHVRDVGPYDRPPWRWPSLS